MIRRLLRRLIRKFKLPLIHSEEVDEGATIHQTAQVEVGVRIDKESTVGQYSYIGRNSLVSSSTIGNYCSIGENVLIGPGEHPFQQFSTSTLFVENPKKVLTELPCQIQHDVWIGSQAIIKRGVTVGTGAIIGANSFVNKNVAPYSIVAGSPAKFIRYRFEQPKIDRLLKSEWWLKMPTEIKLIEDELNQ